MRRVTLVLALAAIMAVLSPGIAHADTAIVPAFVCAELGGNATELRGLPSGRCPKVGGEDEGAGSDLPERTDHNYIGQWWRAG
jgi:hypothetical protein